VSSNNTGSHYSKKRWKAVICYDSQRHNLGSFVTKQEAAFAYDMEARLLGRGEPLNYESIEIAKVAAAQAQADQLNHAPRFKTRCPVHTLGAVVGCQSCLGAYVSYRATTPGALAPNGRTVLI
jgi:hypothetical protein